MLKVQTGGSLRAMSDMDLNTHSSDASEKDTLKCQALNDPTLDLYLFCFSVVY